MKINPEIRKNPFRLSFLSVAVICCVALSIVFFYISHVNNRETQERYTQEKMELILNDFETQLRMMEDVSLRIASNYEFHPYYFEENIARELSMLETFQQYRYYTALTEEYFLYYGGDRIYRSAGSTLDLELFMRTKTEDREEWGRFLEELETMQEQKDFTRVYGELKVLPALGDVYVLIPLRVRETGSKNTAVLGFVVKPEALEERFQLVSGGMEGGMALYGKDGEVLFSGTEGEPEQGGRDGMTVISEDGRYRLRCPVQKERSMQSSLFFLQMVLVLVDVCLVFVIANIFAAKAYRPIQTLTEKYHGKVSQKKENHENALDELGYMMDSMLQKNQEAAEQIRNNQKLLRNQLLQMLLDGCAFVEVLPFLDRVGICLPGPVYCVISLSFEKEEGASKEFLSDLQEELEQLSDAAEKEYIYAVCGFERKLLNVICSMPAEERKNALTEMVIAVAESFAYRPLIGIGNPYQALRNLPASWLESMDELQNRKKEAEKAENHGAVYQYHVEELRRITAVLENGNEKEAEKRLAGFAGQLGQEPMSMLMRQNIMADFLGEMRKLYEKYQLEISRKNISFLISARTAQDFERAAENMIREFCEGYEAAVSREREEESDRICEYINAHFSEYDISIESVAEKLHTSTDAVRQAVLKHTGKLYRDYLIYLRIEYAKVLLCQEDISVADLCGKVGYGNVSYFIKLFREITGVTPAKYRKQAKGEAGAQALRNGDWDEKSGEKAGETV